MENHVERCIASIYAQSVKWSFEIIAVNDASTDNTRSVLEHLATRYPALKVINHHENQKLSGARSTGIRHASGEYVMHIDPDDYLVDHSLDTIFEDNDWDWDILVANFTPVGSNMRPCRYNYTQTRFDMSVADDRKLLFDKMLLGACVAKFFKRDLLQHLNYFDYHYNLGEDRAFNAEVFSFAGKVAFDRRIIYNYPINPDSLTHSGFNIAVLDYEQSWAHSIFQLYKDCKLSKEALAAARREVERNSIGHLLRIRKEKEKKTLFQRWQRFFKSHTSLFGWKHRWYNFLLQLPYSTITVLLFLISPLQTRTINDQLKKLIRK